MRVTGIQKAVLRRQSTGPLALLPFKFNFIAKKKTLVNAETKQSVEAFLEKVPNETRKKDCFELLKIMKKITGMDARIWGKSIIGFGKYEYQRKNGDAFEWFTVGFSPAKAHLSVYLMYDINKEKELLKALGPYKAGKGCLYIKSLEAVHIPTLKKMIAKSKKWRF